MGKKVGDGMKRSAINIDYNSYPQEIAEWLKDAKLYDSSCSPEARVIFVEREQGFFVKEALEKIIQRLQK